MKTVRHMQLPKSKLETKSDDDKVLSFKYKKLSKTVAQDLSTIEKLKSATKIAKSLMVAIEKEVVNMVRKKMKR